MENLFVAHLLLVLVLIFFPKKARTTLLGWQHIALLALLWWDLLSRLYGLMQNQVYFWELCAFYERTFKIEGMFWLLFIFHHVAAFVGLLVMINYFRQSRAFALFWTLLAAYPLLLQWIQSEVQTDLEGQQFYELSQLSAISRDITSLIVEIHPTLIFSYVAAALVLLLGLYYGVVEKRQKIKDLDSL